ncbi:MAG TPA: hypothetical protein PKA58_12920 [Polyangium sp.]|nr:hypothetical protein [Polyangium sp.]
MLHSGLGEPPIPPPPELPPPEPPAPFPLELVEPVAELELEEEDA